MQRKLLGKIIENDRFLIKLCKSFLTFLYDFQTHPIFTFYIANVPISIFNKIGPYPYFSAFIVLL